MSQDAVERFLGRLITDDAFRVRAASALDEAAGREGIALSAEERNLLRCIDFDLFSSLAETIDGCIKRGWRLTATRRPTDESP